MADSTLDREWTVDGVRFRFTLDDGRTAPDAFPLDEGGEAPGTPAVRLLESLWYEDRLHEEEDSYFLPAEELYRLDAPGRRELGLPTETTPVEIELRTSSYAGTEEFSIRPVVRLPSEGIVPADQRSGPFLRTGGKVRLVPESAGRLLRELDLELSGDISDHLLQIGRVRKLAQEVGADLDEYLSGQEIEVPEGISVEAEAVGPDEIRLRPVPVGTDFDLGSGKTQSTYLDADGGKRRRLVLSDDQREAADEVKRNARIQGKDVPKFLDNPEAFVPEEIDLDVFSLRVKGVVPRRYNSQPYVELEDSGSRDWFEADIEIDSVDTTEGPADGGAMGGPGEPGSGPTDGAPEPPTDPDASTPDLAPDVFADLCREVVETGDRHVMHDGDWVEIDPEQARAYLETWEHLDEDERGDFRLPRSDTGYVLDVISNVEELEFVEEEEPEHSFLDEIPEYPTPESLAEDKSLRPYQETGYSWLRFLHEQEYGGLLADDMGLGKTVQVIALMAHLADEGELAPALLVVPAAVMDNWHEEIEDFCPSIQHIYHHRGPNRRKDPGQIEMCQVVLTTYATLRRDQLALGQVDWSLIACDEAQKVKNPTAQRTSAVKAMKSPVKLALTGTPVENGLSELWCIVDYVQPGRLGSRKEFREEFERPIQEGAENQRMELATRLQERLTPHYLRRVKDEVLEDLPERKPDRRVNVPMSRSQRRLYAKIRDAVRSGEAAALGALQNLKQVCSHPDLYTGRMRAPPELVARCPKLDATLSLVDEVQGRGEKVLIYTEYHHMQRILQECLQDRFGIHAPVLNGEVRTGRRHERVQRFNEEPGFGAMLLGPESAGVGLNITGANHVIHYTRLWNPAKENQATDRVYRIGQDRPVQVYYPIVEGDGFTSMEEHLDGLLDEKRKLAKDVVWPRDDLSVRGDMQGWLEEDRG